MSREHDDNLDRAVANRLADLRSVPVDLTGLERRVRGELDGLGRVQGAARWRVPIPALAASVAGMALGLAILLTLLGRPQSVSAAELARVHTEVLSEGPAGVRIAGAADVNRALRSCWPGSPDLKQVGLPVRSCCAHEVCGRRVACMSLVLHGEPVTVAIGRAADLRVADWPVISSGGTSCRCASAGDGNFNAVAAQRDGMVILMFGNHPKTELVKAIDEVRL